MCSEYRALGRMRATRGSFYFARGFACVGLKTCLPIWACFLCSSSSRPSCRPVPSLGRGSRLRKIYKDVPTMLIAIWKYQYKRKIYFHLARSGRHSLGGRILTSVVVIWFCRKSRSPLSVSRLRDAVWRFFSRRAWASSMSYSSMTLAFEGGKSNITRIEVTARMAGKSDVYDNQRWSDADWPPTIGRLSRWVEPRPCRKHCQPTWSASPWVREIPGKNTTLFCPFTVLRGKVI